MGMAPPDLGLGLTCIKYLLCTFNFLFALSGMLLVLTSVMVTSTLSELFPMLSTYTHNHLTSPAVMLGAAGGAVIVVSFFGMWGAIRQSSALINLFSLLMALLLLLELGAGLAAYLLQDGLRDLLYDNIWSGMHLYDYDPLMARAFDRLQIGLQCCGNEDAADWLSIKGHEEVLPSSCCFYLPGHNETDGFADSPCRIEMVHALGITGCLRELGFLVIKGSAFIASTAVVTAFTQFLGIVFACILSRSIRRQKTLRDVRRNQLRDYLINSYSPLETKPMPPITIAY